MGLQRRQQGAIALGQLRFAVREATLVSVKVRSSRRLRRLATVAPTMTEAT
jgi:hypothetical protein